MELGPLEDEFGFAFISVGWANHCSLKHTQADLEHHLGCKNVPRPTDDMPGRWVLHKHTNTCMVKLRLELGNVYGYSMTSWLFLDNEYLSKKMNGGNFVRQDQVLC